MSRRSPAAVVGLLRSRAVVQLGEIREVLGNASRATAFRYLSMVPYRRSYNYNGRYYSLHEPGGYDRHGLRSHGDIHFSRDGSLQATVTRLVQECEAGYTQKELQDLLRVRVQSFLRAAVQREKLARGRVGGLYVYVHTDATVRQAQLECRSGRVAAAREAGAEVSDEVVIHVLLVLIHHPGSQPADVVRRLRGRSPPISMQQVEAVFTRYDLGEKGGLQTS